MSTQPPAFRHARVHIRSGRAFIALLAAFLLLFGLAAPAQAAAGTGTLAGTVTSTLGGPAEGVSVTAYRWDPDYEWYMPVDTTTTDESGAYTLELAVDTYRVCFGEDASSPRFLPACHGARYLWDASDVPVGVGESVTVDGQVAPASHIVGTVTNADGQPLDNVSVEVFEYSAEWGEWDWVDGSAVTAEDGTYGVRLPAGTYRIRFRDNERRGNINEYYQDAATVDEATDVVVDGDTVTVDSQLARSGSISGHIDLPEGAAGDRSVRVINPETGKVVAGGRANSEGDYTISGLQTGSYKVAFNRLSGQAYSAPQFFDGKQEGVGLEGADHVDVVLGEETSSVDAALVPGGSITGSLADTDGNPLGDCHVQAYTADGSLVTRAAYTNWYGGFTITGLSTGEYLLRVVDEDWGWPRCDGGTQFYSAPDGRLSTSEGEGIAIAVALGEDTTLSTELVYTRAARINGHVELPAGALPSDRRLRLLSADSGEVVAATRADEEGNFSIEGLAPGSYKVAYNRLSGQAFAAAQFFDGKAEGVGVDGADEITVALGETVDNVNAALAEGGHITGTVTNANGDGLACRIQAFTDDNHLVTRTALSAPDGSFDIGGLSSGDYLVRVVRGGDCAAGVQYVNAGGGQLGSKTAADPVSVTLGNSVHLDPALVYADAVTISGTVVMTEEMTRDDASVHVVDTATGEQVGGLDYESDETFTYSIDGLAPGSYRVDFGRSSGPAIAAAQFFDNVEEGDVANANILHLAPGERAEDIDAELHVGGSVRGRIVNSAGEPLRCTLQMFKQDESLATRYGHSRADDGTFDMTGLSTGGYLLVARGYDCGRDGGKYYGGPGLFVDDIADAVPVQAHLGEVTQLSQDLVYGDGSLPTLVNDELPTIEGQPLVGSTLTALPGSWSADGATFHFQWLSDGVDVDGATGTTYSPTGADVGKAISVRVTATKDGFSDGVAVSAATASVTADIVNQDPPTIGGIAQVGATLTASPGTWSIDGLSFAYQWSVAGTPVLGATDPTFTVPASAVDKTVNVRVTASLEGNEPVSATSSPTAAVAEGQLTLVANPEVTGTAAVGQVLRVAPGVVSPVSDQVTFQWLRGSMVIENAIGAEYVLVPADAGERISVKVSYTKAGYAKLVAKTTKTGRVAV